MWASILAYVLTCGPGALSIDRTIAVNVFGREAISDEGAPPQGRKPGIVIATGTFRSAVPAERHALQDD